MKKIILLILLLLPLSLMAQEGFFFTKEQHDKIRKNLTDYKDLLVQFDFQSKEFDKMKMEFQLLKELRSKENQELNKLKSEMIDIRNSNIRLDNALAENERLKLKLISVEKDRDYKDGRMHLYLRKYNKEHSKTLGDRIIANTIGGIFISCALMAIYIEIDSRHHTR